MLEVVAVREVFSEPPAPSFRSTPPPEPGSKHWHPDGGDRLPLCLLISRNVTSLWKSGRNDKVGEGAFEGTRVMTPSRRPGPTHIYEAFLS